MINLIRQIIYNISKALKENKQSFETMSQRRSHQQNNHQNDTYNNSINHQYERQSSWAYQDKNSFNKSPGKRPSSNLQSQNNRVSYSSVRKTSVSKLNQIKDRIHDVINLCKDQNYAVQGEFSDVINYEKQILNLLMQNPQLLEKAQSTHNINAQNNPNYQPSHQNREQQITPFRVPPNHFPQSQYYIQSNQQSARGPSQPHQQYIRSGSHEYFVPSNVPQNAPGSNDYLQQNFNSLKNNKQIQLSQDALQLISQIEQKAFSQIEKLRQQKIALMHRLNQQIKNFNNERKKNIELQNQLRQRGFPQGPDGANSSVSSENQYLRSELGRLQNQHAKKNDLINQLQFQLSKKGTNNVPGIQDLLRQGQAIRQETLRLLKLKEAEGVNNQRVNQLERRLAHEQNQKNNAIQQIQSLRAKLRETQVQNNANYSSSRNQKGQSYRKSPTVVRNKSSQYEDMILEMKKISGY